MRYVEARIEEYNREEAYRFYVTKSLQLVPQDKYLTLDWLDMIEMKPEDVDVRTGNEIAEDVMRNAGLRFG